MLIYLYVLFYFYIIIQLLIIVMSNFQKDHKNCRSVIISCGKSGIIVLFKKSDSDRLQFRHLAVNITKLIRIE